MEINLNELVTFQSAFVNVKMFLSGERKIDQENLRFSWMKLMLL
jgi:hypothetical protein